ncbi:MAG: hypothetical protein Q9168_004188 [Polycauliona sp. 1 TL-2023]
MAQNETNKSDENIKPAKEKHVRKEPAQKKKTAQKKKKKSASNDSPQEPVDSKSGIVTDRRPDDSIQHPPALMSGAKLSTSIQESPTKEQMLNKQSTKPTRTRTRIQDTNPNPNPPPPHPTPIVKKLLIPTILPFKTHTNSPYDPWDSNPFLLLSINLDLTEYTGTSPSFQE